MKKEERMKGLLKGMFLGLGLVAGMALQGQVIPDTLSTLDARFTWCFAEGLNSKMLGKPQDAIAFFEKCVELKPEKPDPFYELGNLYAFKNDFAAAAGYARNAWKRDPANKFYGQLLIECLARLGKPEECIPVYHELQKAFPESEEYVTGEIEMLIQAKKFDDALKRLKKIQNNDELKRWGVVTQKEIFEAKKEPKKGIKVIEKWLNQHPGDFELRGILAETYGEAGQNDKALEQYALLKKENPDNPAVSYSLGQFYFKLGRKEEALEEFISGFRSPSVNPIIKIEIVKQFIEGQKNNTTLDEPVRKLIQILYETDKGEPTVDVLFANFLYSEERLNEAEPIYTRLTQTNPGEFVVWQNLLFILNQKSDFERIFQVSDQAIKVFPSQGLFYLFKGIGAIGMKDYEAAAAALNKGLTYPGQNPEITKQFYISLAEALYHTGNSTDAFKNFDMLLGLEPDNVLVLNNYAYYLSLEERDLDKALAMIKKCVEKEKDNATYLDTYAWVLFKTGDFPGALNVIKRVFELDKEPSGEVIEHFGDILFMNGMMEEARAQWIKALEKGETSTGLKLKIESGIKK
jgi:tetratricopeptide (TPR) repeat protein